MGNNIQLSDFSQNRHFPFKAGRITSHAALFTIYIIWPCKRKHKVCIGKMLHFQKNFSGILFNLLIQYKVQSRVFVLYILTSKKC